VTSKPIRSTLIAACALACTGLLIAAPVAAQSRFPERPVRLVVPFPPGGTSDISGRILADALAKELGQPVVVENRAGAGGSVGARHVADANPDGYTLLLGTSSTNGTNSAVYKNLPYDAVNGFTPITRIIEVPGVIAVNRKFPAQTYAEFATLVGASPGKYTYASSGSGGATNMAMEYYKSLSGQKILHIPYRGTGPALTDVIGGQVDMIYDTVASSWAHIKAERLVPVVVAAPERLKDLPDVPTMAEVGLPKANAGFWNGVLAPPRLPEDVLTTLHGAISRALQQPEVVRKYAEVGARVVIDEPADFARVLADDVAKWKQVADSAGIKLD
jgi:tripartite-type tricarboxylate transporter receptor subunit TctC